MVHHPTKYYSFNVFSSDETTVCPLLQTSFLLHKMPPKLFILALNLVLKNVHTFCIIQPAAKMYILCQRCYPVNVRGSNHTSSSLLCPFLRCMMNIRAGAKVVFCISFLAMRE